MKYILLLIVLTTTFDIVADCLKKKYDYTSFDINIEYKENNKILNLDLSIGSAFVDTVNEKAGTITAMTNYIICDNNPEYYCIDSGLFRLIIPSGDDRWPNKWSVNSANHNHLGSRNINIFGKSYNVEVISVFTYDDVNDVQSDPEVYFYSKTHGLMAAVLGYEELGIEVYYFAAQEYGVRLDLMDKKRIMMREGKEDPERSLFCHESDVMMDNKMLQNSRTDDTR